MATSELKWQLLTKKRGSSTKGVPAGKEHLAWVTNTVTLVHGERDAVLVDTFLSSQQSRELVDWVVERGKNLVTIYVTHGHGDHYFGLKILLDRFPNARAVATAPVVAAIRKQINPDFVKSFWEPRFPGQLPSQLTAPQVLDGDTLYLEGEALKVVELGHTDTSHSTGLHAPSIGLVISGDCVYNDTHLYLAECNEKARNEWLQALDRIESLHPKAVVAGHGVLDPDSSPRHIEETRRYLHDFNACVATTSTPLELYERMLSLHPNRVNPGSLWAAAQAAKPSGDDASQPVSPDQGPDMSTIHLHQSTTSTPEQFVAGLTDFGPGRSKLFGNSADEYLKVHHRGPCQADVTEGSNGIWERLHYDWSDPNHVVLTTTDSNVWGGASGHNYTFTRRPNGTTDVDVVVEREGKNLKGRLLGFVLGTIGKGVLEKAFTNSIKAIEARNLRGGAS